MSKPIYKMTHGAIGEAMCCYTDGSYKDADIALTEYENSIRAEERRKFAEWISQYLGKGNTNNVLYTYRQSPVGFIWQTTKSVDEIIAEYEKEQNDGTR